MPPGRVMCMLHTLIAVLAALVLAVAPAVVQAQ